MPQIYLKLMNLNFQPDSAEDVETAVKRILATMTLNQKIGQLQQISYGEETVSKQLEQKIIKGQVGSILNVWKLDPVNQMQNIAMTQSRLKIPLLIGKDVIHGFRTVTPIPLAQAASFNPDLAEQGCRMAAVECSSIGIRWTFSPMVDIARDPRWGRIAQGLGEDPVVAGIMGSAMVRGYQTKDLTLLTSIAACGKHYVGYGATEGGRDYNTTLIPENTLRDIYLAPFKALKDSNCQSYMSAFNDLNGQPSSANEFVLKKVLRKEWGFDGIVVTDYNAVQQLISHGFAQNEKDAACKALNAGIDMEMVSTTFADYLAILLAEGKVKLSDIDFAVSNILRVKLRLGLFDNYNTDPSRQSIILNPAHKELSKNIALQCPVLLQNNNKALPISPTIASIAIIGALVKDGENQIGCWAPDGRGQESVTPFTSLSAALPKTKINYAAGYESTRSMSTSLFAEAMVAANASQKIILFLGEDNGLSGQSNCRAIISLPGVQQQLVRQLSKTNKSITVVIYAGRSLILEPILPYVDAILYAWHLGTMAGPALADLLLGTVSPSGKLPVTFLRSQGQIPMYYNHKNTGRPNNTHEYIPFTSSYIDIDSTPLFPFGYGLSYASFAYSNLKLSRQSFPIGDSILVSVIVKNTGIIKADETVMLFIRDLVGSYTRPVKELKDFKKVTLKSGQSATVNFVFSSNDLRFWTKPGQFKAEAGKFLMWVGPNSNEGLTADFELY